MSNERDKGMAVNGGSSRNTVPLTTPASGPDTPTAPATPTQHTVTEASSDPSAQLTRLGHYTLIRIISEGGMGTVYEAMQDKPRRVVAVKRMHHNLRSRAALRRFEGESQLLARLRHPAIAQVYEAGTERDGNQDVPY